jgi:hypothetical protein
MGISKKNPDKVKQALIRVPPRIVHIYTLSSNYTAMSSYFMTFSCYMEQYIFSLFSR